MGRKLFCQISPLTYWISRKRCILQRKIKDTFSKISIAKTKTEDKLPILVYKHNSLIRRRLGNVDMALQDNKAVNLSLAAPKVSGVLIKPGQTFSFWTLVGNCNEKHGFKEGLVIAMGKTGKGVGGGLCQFTNLIHWMILHSDLEITEHHHHDGIDMFPDYNRQIPFGTGTSVYYNYVDYRFINNTDRTYQLIIYTTDEYLCGELRADKPQDHTYHISAKNEYFSREKGVVYRNGDIIRKKVDKRTGETLSETLLKTNHARVCYDTSHLTVIEK